MLSFGVSGAETGMPGGWSSTYVAKKSCSSLRMSTTSANGRCSAMYSRVMRGRWRSQSSREAQRRGAAIVEAIVSVRRIKRALGNTDGWAAHLPPPRLKYGAATMHFWRAAQQRQGPRGLRQPPSLKTTIVAG